MGLKPELSGELRSMVRDVLREVMAARGPQGPATSATTEQVRVASDSDLAAFVARITEPAVAERIRSGRLRFTLGNISSAAPQPAATPQPLAAPLTGVITEQKIAGLAAGGTLVLAPGAVLTPLARDRARRLGLRIERRR
jgi:hypothetical protein